MTATVTLLQTDLAWAELDVRRQILDAYRTAVTPQAATAARWDAIAYDRANRAEASSLVAELDAYDRAAA